MRTSFKVKGKGQGHQADIMLKPEVRHIFRTEKPTNFKRSVQMEHEDLYRHEGPSPARSKVKVVMSRGTSDSLLAHKSRTKSPRNIKIGK